MTTVSYGAAVAMWDVSLKRGLNLSRDDIVALLRAAEPVILKENAEKEQS